MIVISWRVPQATTLKNALKLRGAKVKSKGMDVME